MVTDSSVRCFGDANIGARPSKPCLLGYHARYGFVPINIAACWMITEARWVVWPMVVRSLEEPKQPVEEGIGALLNMPLDSLSLNRGFPFLLNYRGRQVNGYLRYKIF